MKKGATEAESELLKSCSQGGSELDGEPVDSEDL